MMEIRMKNRPEVVALIDEDWLEMIGGDAGWRCSVATTGDFRAYRNVKQRVRYMHHYVLPTVKGLHVDHINGNTMDNCRANLRYATPSQNAMNQKVRRGGTSAYKGVAKAVGYPGKWDAKIKVAGKNLHIGRFTDELVAARAYDSAANEHYKEFARLNFP